MQSPSMHTHASNEGMGTSAQRTHYTRWSGTREQACAEMWPILGFHKRLKMTRYVRDGYPRAAAARQAGRGRKTGPGWHTLPSCSSKVAVHSALRTPHSFTRPSAPVDTICARARHVVRAPPSKDGSTTAAKPEARYVSGVKSGASCRLVTGATVISGA